MTKLYDGSNIYGARKDNKNNPHDCTCVSSAALAAVIVGELDAAVGAAWVTGVRQAFIDVSFTALSHVASWALALVAANTVHTASLVKALGLLRHRVSKRCAVINVDFAVNTWNIMWTMLGIRSTPRLLLIIPKALRCLS